MGRRRKYDEVYVSKNYTDKMDEVRMYGRQNVINKKILALFYKEYSRTPTRKELEACGGYLEAIEKAYRAYNAFVEFWGYDRSTVYNMFSEEELPVIKNVNPEHIKKLLKEQMVNGY